MQHVQHNALLSITAPHAGADVNVTTDLSQAESASGLQPVPQQLPAGQVRPGSPTEQARFYRSAGTPHLHAPVQSQPQPPVTNAWMEKLLQELSLDDEDGADALPDVRATT